MFNDFSKEYSSLATKKNSRISVGLDPDLTRIPKFISKKYESTNISSSANTVFDFNKFVIDLIAEYVPVVKPQLAYYEKLGWRGYEAYEKTVEYAKSKGLLVIADAKRGDIGSTSSAYADAFLHNHYGGVSAITVNPYLGKDSIIPFFNKSLETGKGLFILVKTSNPGSKDIQNFKDSSGKRVLDVVNEWISEATLNESGYSNIGAVVGATHPAEMAEIRLILKNSLFLVPGIGAQGGDITEIHHAFDSTGNGAIVNSSRGILYPESVTVSSSREVYAHAILSEVRKLNNQINDSLIHSGKLPKQSSV